MSDKIERIIDALRKKILESAIRGELVPQNPADEPASKLLERIAEERERLIKEKKIKKPKSTSRIFRRDGHFYESINGGEPTCIDDDIPFEIPENWEWVRVGEAFFLQAGKNISSGKIKNDYFVDSFPCYGGNGIRGYVDIYNRDGVYPIIGRQGALCGNVNLASGKFYATEHAVCVEAYGDFNKEWVYSALKALNLNQYATATAQPGLAVGVINEVLIPIPPIQEQQRIVNILDAENEKLDTLLQSRLRYNRILYETPTSLRQQLIQSAIQGLLVPQNPDDEPASVLLERIAEERASKQGKKAAKSMSRIERRGSKTYELFSDGSEKDISEDIPFEIPRSWEWARGKSIFAETKNGVPERDFSYIDIDAIDNKRHIIKSGKPTKKEEAPSRARRILESGDVLFSLVRPYLENIALVGKQHASSIASTGFYVVRTKVFHPDFTYSLFLSPYVIHGLNSFMKGDNSPSIRSENIEDFLYPIPPLPEQQRIVRALYKILSHIAL